MIDPSKRKRVTSPELRRLFIDGKLDAQIGKKVLCYEKRTPLNPLHPIGTITVGYECFDSDGRYIGLVFYYKHPNGQLSEPSPKQFLIGEIWHFV